MRFPNMRRYLLVAAAIANVVTCSNISYTHSEHNKTVSTQKHGLYGTSVHNNTWHYRYPTGSLSNNPYKPTNLGNASKWTCNDTSRTFANIRLNMIPPSYQGDTSAYGYLSFHIPDNFNSSGIRIALYENAGSDISHANGEVYSRLHDIELYSSYDNITDQDQQNDWSPNNAHQDLTLIAESDSVGNEYITLRDLPKGEYIIVVSEAGSDGSTTNEAGSATVGSSLGGMYHDKTFTQSESNNGRPLKDYNITFSIEVTLPKCNQELAICSQKYCDDTLQEWALYDYDDYGRNNGIYVNSTNRKGMGQVLTIGDFPECCSLSYADVTISGEILRCHSCGTEVHKTCPDSYKHIATIYCGSLRGRP